MQRAGDMGRLSGRTLSNYQFSHQRLIQRFRARSGGREGEPDTGLDMIQFLLLFFYPVKLAVKSNILILVPSATVTLRVLMQNINEADSFFFHSSCQT